MENNTRNHTSSDQALIEIVAVNRSQNIQTESFLAVVIGFLFQQYLVLNLHN